MEKFRKPVQFYIDEFDKETIKILKALEIEMLNAEAECLAGNPSFEILGNYLSKELRFREKAVELNSLKNEVIAKAADEEKDRKVKRYPIPMGIQWVCSLTIAC